ncbi:hypothetical protein QCA50_000300 [Cerrena zonata]|uniref:Peptidase S54 rhomboid domain-containing protein n=1 Tax=Cerrena zonata TaxID=2478898 RepID=A0AAW0GZU7_9APHY
MITPFLLRRSCTTPFFNSTRPHVSTNILGQLLKHSPVRSTLQSPLRLRQASTLELEAPSILKFVPNNVWRARVPQYGRARDPFRGPPPPNGFWQRLKQQIDNIDPQIILYGILALNGGVFAAWYVAVANCSGQVLTCTISHQELTHMLFNCLTYYWMAPPVLALLGNARFLGLYFGSGILSSTASLFWNAERDPTQHSHGASGAIYSIVALFACLQPTTSFLLFGIVPVPAWAFVAGILAWDGYNAMSPNKKGNTDNAGHVGGILAGIAYYCRLRFLRF